jgi:hypothetical protein
VVARFARRVRRHRATVAKEVALWLELAKAVQLTVD